MGATSFTAPVPVFGTLAQSIEGTVLSRALFKPAAIPFSYAHDEEHTSRLVIAVRAKWSLNRSMHCPSATSPTRFFDTFCGARVISPLP